LIGEGTKHTERIPFGISENDPRAVRRLPDVDVRGAESDESLDFGELVTRAQVEV